MSGPSHVSTTSGGLRKSLPTPVCNLLARHVLDDTNTSLARFASWRCSRSHLKTSSKWLLGLLGFNLAPQKYESLGICQKPKTTLGKGGYRRARSSGIGITIGRKITTKTTHLWTTRQLSLFSPSLLSFISHVSMFDTKEIRWRKISLNFWGNGAPSSRKFMYICKVWGCRVWSLSTCFQGGYPKRAWDGSVRGMVSKMDDDWGYPWFRKPQVRMGQITYDHMTGGSTLHQQAIFGVLIPSPPFSPPFSPLQSIAKPPLNIKLSQINICFEGCQIGQLEFYLIPFGKPFENQGPICRFYPLIVKTSSLRGTFSFY